MHESNPDEYPTTTNEIINHCNSRCLLYQPISSVVKNTAIRSVILVLIILSNVIFTGCKKKAEPATIGATEVSAYFLTPTNGEIIKMYSEVSIEGRIDCKDLMSGWKISIKSKSSGETLSEFQDVYEQTYFAFHHHWFPTTAEEVIITIEALDKNLNPLSSDSVTVTIIE